MYSKQEISLLKQQFWTNFGQYLAPIQSALGEKINWINYKTAVKNIHFKMDVSDHAYIAIEITAPDQAVQQRLMDKFLQLQQQLENVLNEQWIWEEDVLVQGKKINRIYHTMPAVNVVKKEDWPAIISFLKHRIILLDRFWANYREIIELAL